MDEMDDIIKEFLVESGEGLDRLDRSLILLEQCPDNRDLLADIFRCIHTIKGTSGFFGFSRLEAVTHVGENLLSDLRDGRLPLTPAITGALLQLVDAVRSILAAVAATGADGEQDFPELVALLTSLREAPAGPAPVARKRTPARPRPAPASSPSAAATPPVPQAPALAVPAAATPDPARPAQPETSIRVDVALLDKLMTLVGELVLARNQLLQFTETREDPAFAATTQRLNLITAELQEGVMKTRMQPIGNVWSRLPRVVRDLAQACGKQVRIEMDGAGTELDKTIIEAIRDPLTHIVRNAVDHGLELPGRRAEMGKPAEGCLTLRAYHEGGQVNIEIADDGAGVDAARVRAKALEQGIVTAAQAEGMDERALVQLVFAPGFSTAAQVSTISGRGVGMDVVRTNIEKIGGTVELHSMAGSGTLLRLRIPLTLAIIPALIVTASGERFAIPQVSLLELVRLEGAVARQGIEMVHGTPVFRLRGRLLPVVDLAGVLDLQAAPAAADAVHLVILQADEDIFALAVDQVNDTQEIVVKPLGKLLQGLGTFAGATIMGDGRVALILDVSGLAQLAGVTGGHARAVAAEPSAAPANASEVRQALLLFKAGAERRMAIPLTRVARLEQFAAATIERAGGQPVVQYRGGLLPLIRVAPPPPDAAVEAPVRVVVCTHHGHDVGLVVEDILDVVEETPAMHLRGGEGAVSGTAVIQERVTELVDADALVEAAGVPLYATRATGLAVAGA